MSARARDIGSTLDGSLEPGRGCRSVQVSDGGGVGYARTVNGDGLQSCMLPASSRDARPRRAPTTVPPASLASGEFALPEVQWVVGGQEYACAGIGYVGWRDPARFADRPGCHVDPVRGSWRARDRRLAARLSGAIHASTRGPRRVGPRHRP